MAILVNHPFLDDFAGLRGRTVILKFAPDKGKCQFLGVTTYAAWRCHLGLRVLPDEAYFVVNECVGGGTRGVEGTGGHHAT
jgi:hypothetical protein